MPFVSNPNAMTVTIATPAVCTLVSHGLITGDQIVLTTTGALPTGLTPFTVQYYVIRIDNDTFNLATSRANARAGVKIATSGSQSGSHYVRLCPYGNGDGNTTFGLPDMRHVVPVGRDTADVLTDALGLTGGEETHTLLTAEMPVHTHTQNSHGHTQTAHTHAMPGRNSSTAGTDAVRVMNANGVGAAQNNPTITSTPAIQDATAVNQNAGSDGAHNNMQPYMVKNWIIKT
jgi:microcystin-dependent protein